MPTQALSAALSALKLLSTQDMADLVDLLEDELGRPVQPRRRGKTPLDDVRDQAGDELRAALDASAALDKEEIETLILVAQLQHETLQPVTERLWHADPNSGKAIPVARGTVQTKRIRRKVINPETKEAEWHWYGPYLYIRTYAGRSGRRKDEAALGNVYLGRQELAEIFDALPHKIANRQLLTKEILEGYKNGTLDQVQQRWVALKDSLLKDVTPARDLPAGDKLPESDDPSPEPVRLLARRGRPRKSAAERPLRIEDTDLGAEEDWILDDLEELPGATAVTGYVFKIWIEELHHPLIWRRFTVPAGIDFAALHDIVQIVMGWQNYHLYRFGVGDYAITPDVPGYSDRYPDELIDGYLRRPGTHILYEYDFGDQWEHTLALEKQLSRPVQTPRCNAGARACPPEDCGGPWLYDEFLRARKKRKGKVSPKWQDRIGRYWDADAFDKEQINHELAGYWLSLANERE